MKKPFTIMQKRSFYFKLLILSLIILNSFSMLRAQENATKSDSAISTTMFSVNALTSIIGEYGGNAIFSLGDKSQVLLTLNLINSDITIRDPDLNSGRIISNVFQQGFSVAPEYRYILERSKKKNWTLSSFIGAYFMYQQLYETHEQTYHSSQSQTSPVLDYYLDHIVNYSGTSIGLTLGANLYSSSNFFLSFWIGRGIILEDKIDVLFNRSLRNIENLTARRDLGVRSGISIGFYL